MTEKTEKPAPDRPARPELIPVRELRLRTDVTVVDLPSKPAATGVRATDPSQQTFVRLFFDPRIRHHRIEVYDPGPKLDRRPARVIMVPAEWACWSPA